METSLRSGSNALSVALRPAVLAYVLGYLSSAGPKIIQILAQLLLYKRSLSETVFKIKYVLQRAAHHNRLPALCGVIVAGSTVLQPPIRHILIRTSRPSRWSCSQIRSAQVEIVTKFLSAFIGAFLGFTLFNSKNSVIRTLNQRSDDDDAKTAYIQDEDQIPLSRTATTFRSNNDAFTKQLPLVGRSMDFTLFTFARAVDLIITTVWMQHRSRRTKATSWTNAEAFIGRSIDPLVFAVSCSIIMWSWFYSPDRLPHGYNSWISSAAEVDHRLIEALREARYGNFVYGKDTGIAPLLESMCEDYGWPKTWGDPAKTIPIPCEMVHMGTGPNCEKHGISRFGRAWFFAVRMYLPLRLLMLLRQRKLTKRRLVKSFLDASRSSAFLGAFIAFFYYGVCLARTRIGPRIFDQKTISPMQWDSGLCVRAGCLLCGWSILLEKPSRRQELACFVGPRALATVFPRRYEKKHQWKERLVFAFSSATVLTAAQLKPERVRGVLGGLLHRILTSNSPH